MAEKTKVARTGHTLTLAEARELAAELRACKVSARVADIRDWPIGQVRDAIIWLELAVAEAPDNRIPFNDFIDDRRHMRHCRVCGCSDDNACENGCYWVESDLCSECQERS